MCEDLSGTIPDREADKYSNLVAEADTLAKAGLILPEATLGMLGELAGSVTDAVDLAVQVSQAVRTPLEDGPS